MGRGGLPSACNPSFFSVAGLGEPDGWRGKPPATAVQRHASLRHVALGLRTLSPVLSAVCRRNQESSSGIFRAALDRLAR